MLCLCKQKPEPDPPAAHSLCDPEQAHPLGLMTGRAVSPLRRGTWAPLLTAAQPHGQAHRRQVPKTGLREQRREKKRGEEGRRGRRGGRGRAAR